MRQIGALLIGIGVFALLVALALPASGIVRAQELPPRPTLTPVPPPTPTATPAPRPRNDRKNDSIPGRITGTVIDLATSAPAPDIAVTVGDVTVTTDENGNYDRNNLAPGDYTVSLSVPQGRGEPAQKPLSLRLNEGETLVQHLAFGAPPTATPTSVEAPIQVTPEGLQQGPGDITSDKPTIIQEPALLPNTNGSRAPQPVLLTFAVLILLTGIVLRGRHDWLIHHIIRQQ